MRKVLILIAISSLGAIGCRGSSLGDKRWSNGPYGQGSTDRQINRAATFDPYPLNDIGPEVVGGRPRGFMNPLSEPYRNSMTDQVQSPWASYPASR